MNKNNVILKNMLKTVLTEENKLLSLPTNKQYKYKGTT